MKRHSFKPFGGHDQNPGVWDNGHGGLRFVDACTCGVHRERGKDYTGSRPGNNWGPFYYHIDGKRIPNAGPCNREPDDE